VNDITYTESSRAGTKSGPWRDEPLPVWSNFVARRFTQLRSRRRCEEPEQRRGLPELETNFRKVSVATTRHGRTYPAATFTRTPAICSVDTPGMNGNASDSAGQAGIWNVGRIARPRGDTSRWWWSEVTALELLQHDLATPGHKTPPVTPTLPGRSSEAYA